MGARVATARDASTDARADAGADAGARDASADAGAWGAASAGPVVSTGLGRPPRHAASADRLRVAGMTRMSTVDWPDHLVATVFLQGCPWDCFYCHNPALIDPRADGALPWAQVRTFLHSRQGLLDGVVFSGGEPTMQPGLVAAVDEVRALGLGVGLHTGGAYPARLEQLLPRVDWVGLDVKSTPERYQAVIGRPGGSERAWRALESVLAEHERRAGTDRPFDYEVRTTVHSDAIDERGLCELGESLADAGVRTWALQRFRSTGVRDPMPRGTEGRRVSFDALPRDRFARMVIR
ncbi:anaerobic ribonucleoside-triphosphate reductase activating protein [Microbacterium luticocti]|uniref:anaerobic ribonucleoside-triphosphate reductase activating protein n=1 Tax=Microbacterium luticocti TaxID=451764 RepID=UPI000411E7DB|nr:anaerobic ribonucleoside-triphosphate reductase activating protein [Microbacterium luticocti]